MKEPIFKNLTEKEDSSIAALIRNNLENFHLDIPGTAYYDEGLHIMIIRAEPILF